METLTGFSHVFSPDDLNNTLFSRAMSLTSSGYGNSGWHICSQDMDGGEEPMTIQIQFTGWPAVISFWWPSPTQRFLSPYYVASEDEKDRVTCPISSWLLIQLLPSWGRLSRGWSPGRKLSDNMTMSLPSRLSGCFFPKLTPASIQHPGHPLQGTAMSPYIFKE